MTCLQCQEYFKLLQEALIQCKSSLCLPKIFQLKELPNFYSIEIQLQFIIYCIKHCWVLNIVLPITGISICLYQVLSTIDHAITEKVYPLPFSFLRIVLYPFPGELLSLLFFWHLVLHRFWRGMSRLRETLRIGISLKR